MCCIFTCCGWMIDLVQRLWTFTMSCCISSAVCCVMLTASMSGIALGYNYSLAEYIDLKETNVSIYLKRGVFDDEIADDMDWRRSGRMPVAGHIKPDNLMTGSKEDDDGSLSRKSGRRLDDSVFDADDQNKYEGSLMKLTARPQIFHTNPPGTVTDDVQMGDIYSKYPRGSLDNLKAIQSLIDSRRAMGTSGTTFSPLATYNVMNRNFPMYLDAHSPSGRRMMAQGPGLKPGDMYPARKAVPDEGLEAPENWVIPKRPDLFNKDQLPEYEVLSPTYPPPITMNLGPRRTSITTTTMEVKPITFITRTTGLEIPEQPTRSRIIEKFDKEPPIFNDRFLLEGDQPSKSDYKQMLKVGSKSSEEEYEDEIKGLPVRKRRSIIEKPLIKPRTKDNTSLFTGKIDINVTTVENIYDKNAYPSSSEKISDAIISTDVPKYEASDEDKSQGSNILIDRLVTASKFKLSSPTQDATQSINPISAKKIKIVTKKKPFERIIVSSKYVTNNPTKVFDTKQTTLSIAEILNSISISLGEAGLLRNPSFVKLLESTLM